MSTRKKVPDEVQKQVLLQSRRRCCLCFWLDGIDEVVKGQIAHLDQDASNNKIENLAFLCFDHHDEYDSRPNVSKGLQQREVAQWRDELYKEMEHRFRSVRSRKVEFTIAKFDPVENGMTFRLVFRMKNVGQATIANASVSIRLAENMTAESPRKPRRRNKISDPTGGLIDLPDFSIMEMPEMFGFNECTEDFFEPDGRVGTYSMHPNYRGLLPDHSLEIVGLGFRWKDYPGGTELKLDYRIDANEMAPQCGSVSKRIPDGLEWVLQAPEYYGMPKDITLEELEKRVEGSRED